MAIDLDATLILPKASRYPFPADDKALLPLPYGDFLSTLAIPADRAVPDDDDDGGFLPAVSIDRLNWVFCLSARPLLTSPPPHIYVGDYPLPQSPTVYSWVPAGDYGGTGHTISYIKFNTDPGANEVSWRGYGISSAGTLITNPLYAIFDAFSGFGGWTLDDFDWASSFETFRTLTTLGAQMRWCFWQERTYREWLTEILRCYHVDHFETAEGKLAMVLDRGILGLSVSVLNTIDAEVDLEGTQDDVEFEVDESNIVNTLTVRRRLKWTSMEYTDEPTVDFRPSVGLYGALRDEVELPALYTDSHGIIWVKAFFGRYGFIPAIVRFTVRGLGYATALPGTYLGFMCPWLGWSQARLIKILNQDVDPFGTRISFEAFDCGRFVTDEVTLPTVPITDVRRRIRVKDQTVDLTPPGPASNFSGLGSYRRIVLSFRVPGDLDYRYTEIWASQTNNRATAQNFRTGAVGAVPGSMVQESFDVADGAAWYVWLMTVDTSGNGANGGTGPTGGNWWPNSAVGGVNGFLADGTGGVRVQASLINTPGIQPDAIQQLHRQAFGSFGVKLGVNVLAFVTAPIEPQEGYFLFHATATITLPSLCTLALEIHEGTQTGPIWGQQVVPNILNIGVKYPFVCHGQSYDPSWGALYGVVAYVLNMAGQHVSFTVDSFPTFTLIHQKR